MVSVTWIAISITLALLAMWMGVIFLSKRSQAQTAQAVLKNELTKQGLDLTPEELRAATKLIFQKTDSGDVQDLLKQKLLEYESGGGTASSEAKYKRAVENTQAIVNTQANKASANLYKGSMTTNLVVGAVIIVCLGVVMYLLFASTKPYYGYFLGAVAVMAPLFALNFYNTYFFIPLILSLTLAGLFIGLGAREVVIESTLASGGERPT